MTIFETVVLKNYSCVVKFTMIPSSPNAKLFWILGRTKSRSPRSRNLAARPAWNLRRNMPHTKRPSFRKLRSGGFKTMKCRIAAKLCLVNFAPAHNSTLGKWIFPGLPTLPRTSIQRIYQIHGRFTTATHAAAEARSHASLAREKERFDAAIARAAVA